MNPRYYRKFLLAVGAQEIYPSNQDRSKVMSFFKRIGRRMLCLKLARAEAGKFDPDDYVDLIGYAALLAEHLHGENCPLDEDRESRYLRTAERH